MLKIDSGVQSGVWVQSCDQCQGLISRKEWQATALNKASNPLTGEEREKQNGRGCRRES